MTIKGRGLFGGAEKSQALVTLFFLFLYNSMRKMEHNWNKLFQNIQYLTKRDTNFEIGRGPRLNTIGLTKLLIFGI